jgi:molybdopterin-guanine dinucleotide biosynthesis protein A
MEAGQAGSALPEASPCDVAGFVLAGGISSRMGRDKALIELNGETLLVRAARLVGQLTGSVTVVGPLERYSGLGFTVVPDRVQGAGPLGGIDTALGRRQAQWNLILACDLPAVETGLLGELIRRACGSSADCIIPRSDRPEPLCAVYSLSAAPHIRRAVDAGVRKITDALEDLAVDWYDVGHSRLLTNVNTMRDLEAFLG